MKLIAFKPGSIIELDDPTTGKRRLCLVCDTGTEFIDYVDDIDPPTPLAILDVFDPQDIGDEGDWSCHLMESGNVPAWHAFDALILALFDTAAGANKLTRCRAAYWGYKSGDFDVSKAVAAGLLADTEARARQVVISKQAAELLAAEAA
jgi:hypothetical protein